MPYLSSNIPSLIFYGLILSELLRIVQFTLRLTDFLPKPSQLYTRMVTHGGNKTNILRPIKKAFQGYPETLSNYCKTYDKNNEPNNYVLKFKLQLASQKLCICLYLCMFVCVYMHVYILYV